MEVVKLIGWADNARTFVPGWTRGRQALRAPRCTGLAFGGRGARRTRSAISSRRPIRDCVTRRTVFVSLMEVGFFWGGGPGGGVSWRQPRTAAWRDDAAQARTTRGGGERRSKAASSESETSTRCINGRARSLTAARAAGAGDVAGVALGALAVGRLRTRAIIRDDRSRPSSGPGPAGKRKPGSLACDTVGNAGAGARGPLHLCCLGGGSRNHAHRHRRHGRHRRE